MRRLFATIVFVLSTCPAIAQQPDTPYTAVVESGAFVRSGPGKKYYPTSKLKPGTEVKVRRHDPGGWYMIDPPTGSFSWIRSDYVRRTAGRRGVLTANNVVIRVGSEFEEIREVVSRTLSTGAEVEIIGEVGSGAQKFLKIVPPKNEYRWIPGDAVVPKDARFQAQRRLDPYADPFPKRRTDYDEDVPIDDDDDVVDFDDDDDDEIADTGTADGPVSPTPKEKPEAPTGPAVRRNGPRLSDLQSFRDRLQALDQQLRDELNRSTDQWDLVTLETAYRDLLSEVDHPAFKLKIDMRLHAIDRYRIVQADYLEFVELTVATDERDARLANLQRDAEMRTASSQRAVWTGNEPAQPAARPRQVSERPPQSVAINSVRPAPRRSSQPTAANPRQSPPIETSGIVRRSAVTYAGGPRHVLVTSRGRILAYLTSGDPRLNLDQFVGRPIGVRGFRQFHPNVQSTVISVRQLRVLAAPTQ